MTISAFTDPGDRSTFRLLQEALASEEQSVDEPDAAVRLSRRFRGTVRPTVRPIRNRVLPIESHLSGIEARRVAGLVSRFRGAAWRLFSIARRLLGILRPRVLLLDAARLHPPLRSDLYLGAKLPPSPRVSSRTRDGNQQLCLIRMNFELDPYLPVRKRLRVDRSVETDGSGGCRAAFLLLSVQRMRIHHPTKQSADLLELRAGREASSLRECLVDARSGDAGESANFRVAQFAARERPINFWKELEHASDANPFASSPRIDPGLPRQPVGTRNALGVGPAAIDIEGADRREEAMGASGDESGKARDLVTELQCLPKLALGAQRHRAQRHRAQRHRAQRHRAQ